MTQTFDILIRGGRVMDPETGRDEIADVGILGDRIAAIGHDLGEAATVLDATGHVVAPGFIDIHAHGQSIPADRMQAFDGVTTALELELGTLPVAPWYARHAARGRVLNYGTAAAWIFARKAAISGINLGDTPPLEMMAAGANDPRWAQDVATEAQVAEIVALVREGIEDGAIGIGIPNAYAPGTGVKELTSICELAAETGTPTFTHVAYTWSVDPQSSIEAFIRLIGYAGATGAHMHVCHLNSSASVDVERAARILRKAQDQGLPVTVEAYPYGTGSTVISAAFLAHPEYIARSGRGYEAVQVVTTGHRFTDREDLMRAREEDPNQLILTHFLDSEGGGPQQYLLDVSVTYPGGAIASDAMPWVTPEGRLYEGDDWPVPPEMVSHPRSSGTFTRFLSQYVRERGLVPLMEGLAKCALIPARIIEQNAPQIRQKARLQEGCDADIVVFDADTVGDRATFQTMNRTAAGMKYVLVNGVPVISEGALDTAAMPGRPIRRQAQ